MDLQRSMGLFLSEPRSPDPTQEELTELQSAIKSGGRARGRRLERPPGPLQADQSSSEEGGGGLIPH